MIMPAVDADSGTVAGTESMLLTVKNRVHFGLISLEI